MARGAGGGRIEAMRGAGGEQARKQRSTEARGPCRRGRRKDCRAVSVRPQSPRPTRATESRVTASALLSQHAPRLSTAAPGSLSGLGRRRRAGGGAARPWACAAGDEEGDGGRLLSLDWDGVAAVWRYARSAAGRGPRRDATVSLDVSSGETLAAGRASRRDTDASQGRRVAPRRVGVGKSAHDLRLLYTHADTHTHAHTHTPHTHHTHTHTILSISSAHALAAGLRCARPAPRPSAALSSSGSAALPVHGGAGPPRRRRAGQTTRHAGVASEEAPASRRCARHAGRLLRVVACVASGQSASAPCAPPSPGRERHPRRRQRAYSVGAGGHKRVRGRSRV